MRISIYKSSDDRIPVDEATGGETDPILWCRDGEFCIIPEGVIDNAIEFRKSFHAKKRLPPELYFYWSQGIPISNLAGRALVGE